MFICESNIRIVPSLNFDHREVILHLVSFSLVPTPRDIIEGGTQFLNRVVSNSVRKAAVGGAHLSFLERLTRVVLVQLVDNFVVY